MYQSAIRLSHENVADIESEAESPVNVLDAFDQTTIAIDKQNSEKVVKGTCMIQESMSHFLQ